MSISHGLLFARNTLTNYSFLMVEGGYIKLNVALAPACSMNLCIDA